MRRRLESVGVAWFGAFAMLALGVAVPHAAGKGIVALATGGFQVTFGGQERTIQFTAQRDADNNSRGQGELFNHVTGTKLHLEINCLNVVGSVATISGAISRTDNSTYPTGM